MRTLVVIPTYNESANIQKLVPEVLAVDPSVEVLVVDDSSPDGTAETVRDLQSDESEAGQGGRVHLLVRAKKEGLGRAYIAGFKWALKAGVDVVFEMDADFSHTPSDLKALIRRFREDEAVDFVVGSRYVENGGTQNWGFWRRCISRGGSMYSRLILNEPFNDWTGGFNGWRRNVLESLDLDNIMSEGYSFQIELKYRALKRGFRGIESPILFEDRRVGQSKMSLAIVLEAFYRVWMIKWKVQ